LRGFVTNTAYHVQNRTRGDRVSSPMSQRRKEYFSRKGAKAQSAAAFLKDFFAPSLRLCGFA